MGYSAAAPGGSSVHKWWSQLLIDLTACVEYLEMPDIRPKLVARPLKRENRGMRVYEEIHGVTIQEEQVGGEQVGDGGGGQDGGADGGQGEEGGGDVPQADAAQHAPLVEPEQPAY
eukprot:9480445-Pyramimonas_sp.AAC.1